MAQYPHQEDSYRVLNPAGDIDANQKSILGVNQVRGRTNSTLVLKGSKTDTDTPAGVEIWQGDGAGAEVEAAGVVPTATPSTPLWVQRANPTTPVSSTLPASFLTFKWNPVDDVVTLYVNDGGIIRSVAIGTVV